LSRRVRIGILIAVIGVALAIGGVYVLSTLLRQALAPLPAPTPVAAITQRAVVATHNIPLGNVLQAADLRIVDIPVELVPPGTIPDPEQAIGRIVKTQLVNGEMVLQHHLADPTNVNHDVGYIIGDDQVMMAFPASDLMSTLSIPQRGDIIDIFVSLNQTIEVTPDDPEAFIAPDEEEQTETRLFTFNAFQRIEVTAQVLEVLEEQQTAIPVPTTGEGEAPAAQTTAAQPDQRIRAYLLALAPQDALVLKHLKDAGAQFDIVLRSPTSNQLFELTPVIEEYLIDRYQLEVPE
jgi:Flp pilus assembly protein CpaB